MTSVRPASCGSWVHSLAVAIVAKRTRKVSNSGVGEVSSGVRKSPIERARAPQLLRLVQTLNGMDSTIPANTGANHQNIEGASHQINPLHTMPTNVCPQCRRNA